MSIFQWNFDTSGVYVDAIDTIVTHVEKTPEIDICRQPATSWSWAKSTGGYVYRGSAIPDLVGWYVFGDFITGQIYAVPEDSPTGTSPEDMDASGLSIVSFGQDQNGELYVVDFSGTLHMVVQGP